MAAQSTLALSPVDPAVYAAVRAAHRPPRKLWLFVFRLLFQYGLTVPAVVISTPFVVLRNILPFLRKHPAWSFKTAVSTTLVRIVITCMGVIRFCPPPRAEDGWMQGNSAAGSLVTILMEALTWGSFGSSIWADSKNVPHLRHIHGKRLDRVWVSPPPVNWLRGILTVRDPSQPLYQQICSSPLYRGRPMIEPGFAKRKVKCFWYLSTGSRVPPHPHDHISKRTKPVLLYIHGGAGVSFSAGDAFMGATLAAFLARTADIDVFTVDYDLAPYAKYPTTLAQVFGAWLYLILEVGFEPSQIFIGGDSYGGLSALLFNRYLRDVWPHLETPSFESLLAVEPTLTETETANKAERLAQLLGDSSVRSPVPTPGLILLSPWLHVSDLGERFPSRRKAIGHDIVTLQYMNWGTDSLEMTHKYIKTNSLPTTDPWVSPCYMEDSELSTLPPLWVGNGGAEALLDEGTELVRRARVAGCDAEHFVQPGMPHDFYSIPFEINNSMVHYRLLQPWLATHYSCRGQRSRSSSTVAPALEGEDVVKDNTTDIEAHPREMPEKQPLFSVDLSGSRDSLADSKDTLKNSGVMLDTHSPLSSQPAPIRSPPVKEQDKSTYQPSAPASIATTDDAAFESAPEPDSPRPEARELEPFSDVIPGQKLEASQRVQTTEAEQEEERASTLKEERASTPKEERENHPQQSSAPAEKEQPKPEPKSKSKPVQTAQQPSKTSVPLASVTPTGPRTTNGNGAHVPLGSQAKPAAKSGSANLPRSKNAKRKSNKKP